ncbi:MAG: PTS sugar transporter subunit IIB [Brevinema sp.]
MKIILCCMSGMSTSLLVKRMQTIVPKEVEIIAVPVEEGLNASKEADIILLGPQISFKEKELQNLVSIPVASIPMVMYGTMNAEGVLDIVRQKLPNNGVL